MLLARRTNLRLSPYMRDEYEAWRVEITQHVTNDAWGQQLYLNTGQFTHQRLQLHCETEQFCIQALSNESLYWYCEAVSGNWGDYYRFRWMEYERLSSSVLTPNDCNFHVSFINVFTLLDLCIRCYMLMNQTRMWNNS